MLWRKRVFTICILSALLLNQVTVVHHVQAAGPAFVVDGDIKEWAGVTMQSSDDGRIAGWAVAQDEDTYYFYVQQNGGNAYGLPITQTNFKVVYDDGSSGRNTMFQFAGMMDAIKDGWYADVSGTKQAYRESDEADKYEIEFSIPKTFFENKDFTLKYCGAEVKSSDIVSISDLEEVKEEEPVYQGITVDGSFKDWAAVSKTSFEDKYGLLEAAMVFDGDYVYIYLKEDSDGALLHSGPNSNGAFTIYTDLGRNTVFQLSKDSIKEIEGSKVKYSNRQYEISLPAAKLKQYKDTISFGYYMEESMLIENVANLKEEGGKDVETKIVYDGLYEDWAYYPHQLVEYSTPGKPISDAEAALYQEDAVLYGHVKTYLNRNCGEFKDITIRFNEKDDCAVNLTLVSVDAEGNINRNPDIRNLAEGTYEYYLWDRNSGSSAKNIHDEDAPVYGRIYVTVNASDDEMEFRLDLNKVAAHLEMDVTDMKTIQAQYINIGNEWVSIAGTSTGAVGGIIVCLSLVAAVLFRQKKRAKVA